MSAKIRAAEIREDFEDKSKDELLDEVVDKVLEIEKLKRKLRICGLKPSHDSGVDVCPPCAQSASSKIA